MVLIWFNLEFGNFIDKLCQRGLSATVYKRQNKRDEYVRNFGEDAYDNVDNLIKVKCLNNKGFKDVYIDKFYVQGTNEQFTEVLFRDKLTVS